MDHSQYSHKKFGGNRPRGCTWRCQNVFCFFVTNTMQTFGHLSCTDFDCLWDKRCESVSHAYNFRISAHGILQVPKQLKIGYIWGGVCDKATAQTAQFWAMGIVSGPSRHPKHVPFVSAFWWATYSFGAISPWKEYILANFHI